MASNLKWMNDWLEWMNRFHLILESMCIVHAILSHTTCNLFDFFACRLLPIAYCLKECKCYFHMNFHFGCSFAWFSVESLNFLSLSRSCVLSRIWFKHKSERRQSVAILIFFLFSFFDYFVPPSCHLHSVACVACIACVAYSYKYFTFIRHFSFSLNFIAYKNAIWVKDSTAEKNIYLQLI